MSGLQVTELNNKVANDEKWQKLVLYYLARLKGLCDWRPKIKPDPKKCSSQDLETRIIDRVSNNTNTRLNKKQNDHLELHDVGSYMAAGYAEGKQQAVKIISRSLKYGVMTGILLKRGNCYRIAPEYLNDSDSNKKNIQPRCNNKCNTRHKFSVKSVKKNVRKKQTKQQIEASKTNIRGNKRKIKQNNSKTSIARKKGLKRNYDETSDESPSNSKKNKRTSDTNVNLNESSNSYTSLQTLSRSLTPIDDRKKKKDVRAKRPRPKIQKPINYVPPLKKPRTKSQSKSPSHHTDDDEVREVQNVKNKSCKLINRFRMPRLRRYSDIMSSMSSSSLSSSCTICDDEKNHVVKRTRRK